MKFIAWDTSSKSGAIVAMEATEQGLRLCHELNSSVDTAHSEGLLYAIDQVMQACRWSWADIDFIGLGVGPGSFTGLRIGVTTARTLAHVLGKKIVPVSSLEALARPTVLELVEHNPDAAVWIATDACKGELFVLSGRASEILAGRYDEAVLTKNAQPHAGAVQGRHLGQVVWENYQKNGARTALEVTPRYLRASDAEVKLKSKGSQAFAKKA